jgi:predicted CopG family antitoxin
MAMKTIYIEIDAYKHLLREKRERNESFSSVIRRLFAERPALTAGELLDVMHAFEGKGAGRRRLRRTGREFVRPPDASSRPR